MSKKELYQIRSTANPDQWRVLKVDLDFNPTGEYSIGRSGPGFHLNCSCFAGTKSTCRHRTMFPEFELSKAIDSNKWYHFDKKEWIEGPKNDA